MLCVMKEPTLVRRKAGRAARKPPGTGFRPSSHQLMLPLLQTHVGHHQLTVMRKLNLYLFCVKSNARVERKGSTHCYATATAMGMHRALHVRAAAPDDAASAVAAAAGAISNVAAAD